jgi:hypothetical protein
VSGGIDISEGQPAAPHSRRKVGDRRKPPTEGILRDQKQKKAAARRRTAEKRQQAKRTHRKRDVLVFARKAITSAEDEKAIASMLRQLGL